MDVSYNGIFFQQSGFMVSVCISGIWHISWALCERFTQFLVTPNAMDDRAAVMNPLFLFLRSTRYFSRGRQPLHIPLPQSALVEANLSQYWFGEKQQLGSQRWFLIPHLLRARCVTLHIYSLSLGFCFLIGKMGALL